MEGIHKPYVSASPATYPFQNSQNPIVILKCKKLKLTTLEQKCVLAPVLVFGGHLASTKRSFSSERGILLDKTQVLALVRFEARAPVSVDFSSKRVSANARKKQPGLTWPNFYSSLLSNSRESWHLGCFGIILTTSRTRPARTQRFPHSSRTGTSPGSPGLRRASAKRTVQNLLLKSL